MFICFVSHYQSYCNILIMISPPIDIHQFAVDRSMYSIMTAPSAAGVAVVSCSNLINRRKLHSFICIRSKRNMPIFKRRGRGFRDHILSNNHCIRLLLRHPSGLLINSSPCINSDPADCAAALISDGHRLDPLKMHLESITYECRRDNDEIQCVPSGGSNIDRSDCNVKIDSGGSAGNSEHKQCLQLRDGAISNEVAVKKKKSTINADQKRESMLESRMKSLPILRQKGATAYPKEFAHWDSGVAQLQGAEKEAYSTTTAAAAAVAKPTPILFDPTSARQGNLNGTDESSLRGRRHLQQSSSSSGTSADAAATLTHVIDDAVTVSQNPNPITHKDFDDSFVDINYIGSPSPTPWPVIPFPVSRSTLTSQSCRYCSDHLTITTATPHHRKLPAMASSLLRSPRSERRIDYNPRDSLQQSRSICPTINSGRPLSPSRRNRRRHISILLRHHRRSLIGRAGSVEILQKSALLHRQQRNNGYVRPHVTDRLVNAAAAIQSIIEHAATAALLSESTKTIRPPCFDNIGHHQLWYSASLTSKTTTSKLRLLPKMKESRSLRCDNICMMGNRSCNGTASSENLGLSLFIRQNRYISAAVPVQETSPSSSSSSRKKQRRRLISHLRQDDEMTKLQRCQMSDYNAASIKLTSTKSREKDVSHGWVSEIDPALKVGRSFIQKYKPRWMGEIVGQEGVVSALSNDIFAECHKKYNGKVEIPIYLFHGARGAGKTSAAKVFAASLICTSDTLKSHSRHMRRSSSARPISDTTSSTNSMAAYASDPSACSSRSVSGRFAVPTHCTNLSSPPMPCSRCRKSPYILEINASAVSAAAAALSSSASTHGNTIKDDLADYGSVSMILDFFCTGSSNSSSVSSSSSSSLQLHSPSFKVCIIEECHLLTHDAWRLLFTAIAAQESSLRAKTRQRSRNAASLDRRRHELDISAKLMNSYSSDHHNKLMAMASAAAATGPHPQRLLFILITSDAEQVPKAMASRCQKLAFAKISIDDIEKKLQEISATEGIEADDEALRLIATRSDGSLCEAETVLDQLSNLGRRITAKSVREMVGMVEEETVMQLLEMALCAEDSHYSSRLVRCVGEVVASGVDPLSLISQLARLITDLLAGIVSHSQLLRSDSKLSREQEEKLKRALRLLSEGEKQLRADNNNRVTWLVAALLRFKTLDFFRSKHSISTLQQPTVNANQSAIASPNIDHASMSSMRSCLSNVDQHSQSKDSETVQQEDEKNCALQQADTPSTAELKDSISNHSWSTVTHESENVQASSYGWNSRGMWKVQRHRDSYNKQAWAVTPANEESSYFVRTSRNGYGGHKLQDNVGEVSWDMTHSTMDDLWEKVLDGSPSSVLRHTLSSEGKLVSLSVAEGHAVAHLEFRTADDMRRAEDRKDTIAKSFQLALGCPVRVKLTLADTLPQKTTANSNARPIITVDKSKPDPAGFCIGRENPSSTQCTTCGFSNGNPDLDGHYKKLMNEDSCCRCAEKPLRSPKRRYPNRTDHSKADIRGEEQLGSKFKYCLQRFSRPDEPKSPATRAGGFLCWKMGSRWKNSESLLKEVILSIRTKCVLADK